MLRNYLLFAIAAITIIGIQGAYATHVSQPIMTVEQSLVYSYGDNLTISGWVNYSD